MDENQYHTIPYHTIPPNPNVVLKRFTTSDSDSDVTSSDNSRKSLSSWLPMKRRLGNVVKDTADNRTKKLSQAIHHIICENQLLHQENEGLREAVTVKKKRTLKTQPFKLKKDDLANSSAMWWSPQSIRAEKQRIHQEQLDKEQKKQQKEDNAKARKASQVMKAKLVEEGKAQRRAAAL
jgi:hypothetical protein